MSSDPSITVVIFCWHICLVSVMPTAVGDLPDLAHFRAALERAIRFVTIRYPSRSEMIDAGSGFDVLINAAVAQILAERDNDIYLLGNSFGGFVAFEAARRIMESGRKVSFIGLIDRGGKTCSSRARAWASKRVRLCS